MLYGGTALALRLGHRESIDFNFFSADPLEPLHFNEQMHFGGDILQAEPNTLNVMHEGVKLSFFGGLSLGVVEAPDLPSNSKCYAAMSPKLLYITLHKMICCVLLCRATHPKAT